MGRYIKDVQLEQPIDVVSMVMDDFIYHNHFSRTDWNGEMVFYLKDRHKKERYMKWVYVDGQFHVEAWLKNAFGGEMDLDGVGGGASRREFRASMDGLIETLKKTAAGSLAGGHIGSDPLHHEDSHADVHDVWKQDTRWQQGPGGQTGSRTAQGSQTGRPGGRTAAPVSQAGQYRNPSSGQGNASRPVQTGGGKRNTAADPEANVSMIFAILALMFSWALPILSIVFIVLARRKLDYSSNPKLVNILCVLAVVVMVIWIVGNIAVGLIGAIALGL